MPCTVLGCESLAETAIGTRGSRHNRKARSRAACIQQSASGLKPCQSLTSGRGRPQEGGRVRAIPKWRGFDRTEQRSIRTRGRHNRKARSRAACIQQSVSGQKPCQSLTSGRGRPQEASLFRASLRRRGERVEQGKQRRGPSGTRAKPWRGRRPRAIEVK